MRIQNAVPLCTVLILPVLPLAAEAVSGRLSEPPIETRGPVQNTGMTIKVDRDGVQAPGYHWEMPEAKSEWKAQWIGSTDKGLPDSSATCLRKEITLDQTPKKVTAWISGDNYLLYVNGIPAGRGSADQGRDFVGAASGRRFYETRDLTPFFHQGKNTVAVELLGSNKLLLELLMAYPDLKKVTFVTDETWRGVSSRYLLKKNPAEEDLKVLGVKPRPLPFFDAEAEPQGWLQAGYDDSNWPFCRVTEAPKEQLVMSELPPLMEVRYPYFEIMNVQGNVTVPHEPLTPGHPIVVKGDGQFSVHFDKIMSGRCGIKVNGAKGARILLLSNETSAIGGSRAYQIALRDGVQTFESRDYYALGTVTVVVRDATTPVEILDVTADFLSQPVEYRGSFSCSDEELNKLYKSARWSTQICMITHHLDSPQHQEPISDYGDYLIADLVNYYTMGSNPWLAKQDLRKWAWVMENANYKTFHTSYMFYWLQSLLNYYDYTGDRSVIDELAPNVHAVIDQFSSYIGKNGIISEAPNYMFMDWVNVHDDRNPKVTFACHHPPAVIGQGYMTALFYQALGDAIRISQINCDQVQAEKYEKLRKQVGEAFEKELWNSDRGLYRDGKPFVTTVSTNKWMPADVQMESFSVQNNALATLAGIVPQDRRSLVMEATMTNTNWDVTPYFMHFVFNALDQADLFGKYGVQKMHEYKVIPETQTVREMGPEKGDYSHGWIATPAYQMPSKILGVRPTSPSFSSVLIKPEICGLSWAKGSVPTPHGNVDVSWKVEGNKFTLDVTIPPGTTARIEVPGKDTQFIDKRDGSSVPKSLGIMNGRTAFEALTESYSFTSTLTNLKAVSFTPVPTPLASFSQATQQVIPLWQVPAPQSKGTNETDIPDLTVYLPPEAKSPTPAIVICPGGGYGGLAITHEGTNVAQYFQSHGVAAFVLRYRLPKNGYLHPVPLMDVQRAIRLVRSHAQEWYLDPSKIGVIGFSAGGHLASTLSTHFDSGNPEASDPVDRMSCRPDFAMLVYPVISSRPDIAHHGSFANLLGPNPDPALLHFLSNETQVTANTPPTVLVHALDDKGVPPQNSELYYQALQKAGVSSTLQEYSTGGHGFGYGKNPDKSPPGWLEKACDWLRTQRLL